MNYNQFISLVWFYFIFFFFLLQHRYIFFHQCVTALVKQNGEKKIRNFIEALRDKFVQSFWYIFFFSFQIGWNNITQHACKNRKNIIIVGDMDNNGFFFLLLLLSANTKQKSQVELYDWGERVQKTKITGIDSTVGSVFFFLLLFQRISVQIYAIRRNKFRTQNHKGAKNRTIKTKN